jgi:hypothetical protein
MKRTPLKRTPMKRKAPPRIPSEKLARAAWKASHNGPCGVCGRRQPLLRHHVIYEQHVRKAGGDPWNLRNALDVGLLCDCHRKHHASGPGRVPIPLGKIPTAAVEFAADLFGKARARLYFDRYYRDH